MPRKQPDYPNWVMKHKTKGTYINKVGDKYYLYAAHSERIKGTNKVRRISDGYIGRITEEHGLIPAGKRLKSEPESFEVGLSFPIVYVSTGILKGMLKSYRKNGKLIYCCSIISYIYETYSKALFDRSYLSLRFPDVSFPERFSPSVITGIERGTRMLGDHLPRFFGDDLQPFLCFFPDIRLLKINAVYYLTGHSDITGQLSKKHGIEWEDALWQK